MKTNGKHGKVQGKTLALESKNVALKKELVRLKELKKMMAKKDEQMARHKILQDRGLENYYKAWNNTILQIMQGNPIVFLNLSKINCYDDWVNHINNNPFVGMYKDWEKHYLVPLLQDPTLAEDEVNGVVDGFEVIDGVGGQVGILG